MFMIWFGRCASQAPARSFARCCRGARPIGFDNAGGDGPVSAARTMRNTTLVILTGAVLAVNAVRAGEQTTNPSSAGNQTEAPSMDQVLEKYVTAIGGKAAAEKPTTRLLKGTVEGAMIQAPAPWESWAKAPNKRFSSIEVSGFGAMKDGYDGTVAWSQNPFTGLSEKQGEELAKQKRDGEFYRELKLKSVYPDLASKGREKLAGGEAYVLESKPTPKSLERFYFDSQTGLLTRQDSEFETVQGRVTTAVLFEDYRAVDGVKYPFRLRFKLSLVDQPATEITIKLTEIKHGLPMEDEKLARPKS